MVVIIVDIRAHVLVLFLTVGGDLVKKIFRRKKNIMIYYAGLLDEHGTSNSFLYTYGEVQGILHFVKFVHPWEIL